MLTLRMMLVASCLCVAHVALVSAGLFARRDAQTPRSGLAGGRAGIPQSAAGIFSQGKHRPLFARRGHYERQRINVLKPKDVPVLSNNLPTSSPNITPKPVKADCSELSQSCFPQSGCCDPCAVCHCRFFNAICFCRRMNSLHPKKT